jgi:hypothetical protein
MPDALIIIDQQKGNDFDPLTAPRAGDRQDGCRAASSPAMSMPDLRRWAVPAW